MEYAYSAPGIGQGRFKRVDGPGLPVNGVQYTYVADSDLLDKLESRGTMGAVLTRADYTHEASRDLVTAVENQAGSGLPTVSKYDYGQGDGYDALGRRTSVVNTGTAFGDAALSLWSYSDRSELTSAYRHEGDDPADPDDEITAQRRVYDYDHIGNRKDHTAGTAGPVYYCANDLNQYEHLDDQQGCPSPAETLAYDADGNLTGDGVYVYAWDAENRLVAVAPVGAPADGDKRLDFKYDYMSRRVEKVYSTYDDVGDVWVAQATYRFVYDEWNVVMVLDDNNSTLRKYTWGLDLSRDREGAEGIHGAGGIGGLLAVEETAEQGSPAYWFFYDANGNVGQAIKASDQSIAAKYEYDPYGNVVSQSYSYADVNPFRFSTKWFDTELAGSGTTGAVGTSGLGYWGYRYYSPRLGRWVNRDPIEEAGGANLYLYVLNTPTDRTDLLGLAGCEDQCDSSFTKCQATSPPINSCQACKANCYMSCMADGKYSWDNKRCPTTPPPGPRPPSPPSGACSASCIIVAGVRMPKVVGPCTAVALGEPTPVGEIIVTTIVCACIVYAIVESEAASPLPRDRQRKKKGWTCTVKARNWAVGTPCYGRIFTYTHSDRSVAKTMATSLCQAAGCHRPGPGGGDCGHATCYRNY